MSIAGDVRHVVLVVFDTLRRDAVGSYGTAPPWAAGEAADPTSLSIRRRGVRRRAHWSAR